MYPIAFPPSEPGARTPIYFTPNLYIKKGKKNIDGTFLEPVQLT